MLVDCGNALFLREHRVRHDDSFAPQDDLPAVRLMDAGQRFDKGGFARAVFPDEGVNLPGLQIKMYVVKGLNAGKYLGDALHFEDVLRFRPMVGYRLLRHRLPPFAVGFYSIDG